MKYWKSEHFKALQSIWYRHLEDTGFHDAEQLVDGTLYLKQQASHPCQAADPERIERDLEYYSIIAAKIHDAHFSKPIDCFIMQCRAHGWKINSIVAALKSMGIKRKKHSITYRIRVYEMRWGIRQYTRKELNLKVS